MIHLHSQGLTYYTRSYSNKHEYPETRTDTLKQSVSQTVRQTDSQSDRHTDSQTDKTIYSGTNLIAESLQWPFLAERKIADGQRSSKSALWKKKRNENKRIKMRKVR